MRKPRLKCTDCGAWNVNHDHDCFADVRPPALAKWLDQVADHCQHCNADDRKKLRAAAMYLRNRI